MSTATTTAPVLTAADVTVTVDQLGRDTIVIPDAVAAELRKQVNQGWREIPDMADGYSRPFAPGSWTYETTTLIIDAYAASEPPAELSEEDAETARRNRRWASGDHARLSAVFIIGRSGWDPATRWWAQDVRSDAHKALSVPGYPGRAVRPNPIIEYTG